MALHVAEQACGETFLAGVLEQAAQALAQVHELACVPQRLGQLVLGDALGPLRGGLAGHDWSPIG